MAGLQEAQMSIEETQSESVTAIEIAATAAVGEAAVEEVR